MPRRADQAASTAEPAGTGTAARADPPAGWRTDFLAAVYLRFASQVLGLAMPLAMMLVVDKVVSQGAVNTLVVLVIGVTLLTLFQYLFLWFQARHSAHLVEARAHPDRHRLFTLLLRGVEANALANPAWDVMQGAMDDARFDVETRPQMVADVAFIVLLALCMAMFHPLLLAVSAAFLPLYLLVESRAGRRALVHAQRAGGLRNATTGRFLETMAAVELVRSLHVGDRLRDVWSSADGALAAARCRGALVRRGAALGVEFLQRLSVIVVMLLGVQAVIAGAMTLGQYIAFNLLSLQLTQPVLRLAAYLRAVDDRRLRSDARHAVVTRCLSNPWPDTGSAVPERRAAVSLQVSELVVGGVGASVPVSFSLLGGGWLGVTGASGVGKSTLLRTLAGLRLPESGELRVNGVVLHRIEPEVRAKIVRLVPQEPVVFTATVAENIGLGAPAACPEDIVAAAAICGLTPVVQRWPAQLDTVIGTGGRPLSGGERQRIALARAIAGRPEVLLLDEATSALDRRSEARLLGALRRFLPRSAVVVVSHRAASLATCDQILPLDVAGQTAPALALAAAP